MEKTEKGKITLLTSIAELNLSSRAHKCLRFAGINTVGDVISRGCNNLCKIRNMGKITLEEIEDKFSAIGFELTDEGKDFDSDSLEETATVLKQEVDEIKKRIDNKKALLERCEQLLKEQADLTNTESELDKRIKHFTISKM